MPLERWGSLSVDDHKDPNELVSNVLLFDRLVIPVMTEQSDRNEERYWRDHGWAPDLQRQRLDQLGDLAVRRPWDARRRALFKTRLDELVAERLDAAHLDAKHVTRRILADERVEKPRGVHGVTVVAAYRSLPALRKDFDLSDRRDNQAAQALLLARRLAVPESRDPEDSLRLAIALSRDEEFRMHRSNLFDWQETAIARGLTPEEAVSYVVELGAQYNRKVEQAAGKVAIKFAYTIAGAALAFAAGGPIAASAAGVFLSFAQFATLEGSPVVEAGSSAPVAVFYDIEQELDIRLR
jgi:hypothetical protein